jgi:hypothetical protein
MTDTLRPASAAPFPYGYPGIVCYLEQTGTEINQMRSRDDLRGAVRRAHVGESRLVAVWPGQYRSDAFIIDDLAALAEEIKVDLS